MAKTQGTVFGHKVTNKRERTRHCTTLHYNTPGKGSRVHLAPVVWAIMGRWEEGRKGLADTL